ncbi:Thioredoxin-2, partial [Trachymyrmex cornetzi]
DDLQIKLKDAGNNLVVIDFFAVWCGPCKMIGPLIEELSKEMLDVVFLKVDVDECEDIAAEYEISSMPTFVFIKEGKVVCIKFESNIYLNIKNSRFNIIKRNNEVIQLFIRFFYSDRQELNTKYKRIQAYDGQS